MEASQATFAAWQWLIGREGRRIAAMILIAAGGSLAFITYELVALGLPIAREAPATFDSYHGLRTLFAGAAAALLLAAFVEARDRGCALDAAPISPAAIRVGLASIAAAAAATALFASNPATFHAYAQEDRPLEWASALLLLGASALFGIGAAKQAFARAGRLSGLILAGAASLGLLVIGMEEISWGQRLFGFATPDELAAVNWQGEFNLHNVQTDLSELVYYAGAGLFLGTVPLLRDLLAPSLLAHPLGRFVPGRGVALIGAPAATFSYGHWDLLPLQLVAMLSALALAVWSWAAARRGDRVEAVAFAAAALVVVATQVLFLLLGTAMVELPDSTEYREFFIALGLAWYAFGAAGEPRAAG